jgi:hypothetical protein
LNDTYQYGPDVQDFTAPAVVVLATLGLAAGDPYYVLFKGGQTESFDPDGPLVDNAGYTGSVFKDDHPGSSGEYFPSLHLPGEWGTAQETNDSSVDGAGSGVFLNALVGAWTDDSGAIISPFSLGTYTLYDDSSSATLVGFSGTIPTGATRIQFGINDDYFYDNSGSLQVCVASTDPEVLACASGTAVPEPASLMFVGAGLAGLAVCRRRRRSC